MQKMPYRIMYILGRNFLSIQNFIASINIIIVITMIVFDHMFLIYHLKEKHKDIVSL